MDDLPQILIVDDEPLPRQLLRQALLCERAEVVQLASGDEVLTQLSTNLPDLVIMDVRMPNRSGIDVVKSMRTQGLRTPVILLTCFGDVDELVAGLEAGADDCLVKPFDPRELVARVRSRLRRAELPPVVGKRGRTGGKTRLINIGRSRIDLEAKRAELDGAELFLTKTEFEILECLAQGRGQPVSRDQLLFAVWGYGSDTYTRTVQTHVWRLRKKLGDTGESPGTLQTRSGLGYSISSAAFEELPPQEPLTPESSS
jgi:DNA-binding response OmpR family regulator